MEYLSFVLKHSVSVLQYADVNSLSLSLMISSGSPWILANRSRHKYPSSFAVYVSLNGRQCAHFEYRSTMTQMLSYLTLVVGSSDTGNFVMKSIVTDCHGLSAGLISYGTLLMCVLCLFFWQLSHCRMKFLTCCFMLSK